MERRGRTMRDADLAEMDAIWDDTKRSESR
jgi:uncharacterized protein YabN with tetrapyrrole methylase and pyrophosphatase domain